MEYKKKLYIFVPPNISDKQKGIQALHVSLRFIRKYKDSDYVLDFVDNHETCVMLNGGTMNDDPNDLGGMNKTLKSIIDYNDMYSDLEYAYFRERDLNNGISAICVIADERVYEKNDYPNFKQWMLGNNDYTRDTKSMFKKLSINALKHKYVHDYDEWLTFIGGKKNELLKEIINDKKLA